MSLDSVPPSSNLSDGQYIQIVGADGIITGYEYSSLLKTLYFKESQVLYPSFHGYTHVSSDPVPEASCDLHGLMSANDKCKLDSLVGTRLGVLGFMGAGFPDDGGWLQGDIILAAGTEFITLERIGNVVRFTVDSPIPLNCSCESCAQIFWVQDETDISAIRPPTCGGVMPSINGYGELKIYAFPSTALFDPNNPAAKLNLKANYPSLLFTRYNNGITPGLAEFDCILMRDSYNNLQTQIGWTMTPGAGTVPEMVWFMSKDSNGNQITFSLDAETTPGLLGGLLYNGSLITKRPAVITGYTTGILTTNQYTCMWWDLNNKTTLGTTSFTATNVWMYNNPQSTPTSITPQQLVTDVSIDVLPVGTIVEVMYIQVGIVAGTPILNYYFNARPNLSPNYLWATVGGIQFGDTLVTREEFTPVDTSTNLSGATSCDDTRLLEKSIWGLTGVDDPFTLYSSFAVDGPTTLQYNIEPLALVDNTLPGLIIQEPPTSSGFFSERPVFLWNRHEVGNAYVRFELGRPDFGSFSPLDVLINAPIDSYGDVYMVATNAGSIQGYNFVTVTGVGFNDLPQNGAVRVISPDTRYNTAFRYSRKLMWIGDYNNPNNNLNTIVLIADSTNNAYNGNIGDVLQLLHADYDAPCVRFEITPHNDSSNSISLQVKVGDLSMAYPYEGDPLGSNGIDDYIRGLAPGYSISQVYTQASSFTGVGTPPPVVPTGFAFYDGGAQVGGTKTEYWNLIEILFLSYSQAWVFWNGLLITPNTKLSASLDYPVGVTSPYFPITTTRRTGKCGLRMWPGTKLRSLNVLSQLTSASEMMYGQISLT